MRRLTALLVCTYSLVLCSQAQDCTEVLGAVRDVSTSEGSKTPFFEL
jgi:hypothetical protein